ncbi:kyphoscoliosis peptidase-like [Saccostrea cucullata]|uniref:kyphoscoliosis peptidase-like n=1 Tax=Saccostrea cuccullata TaxID=36930 RepID=UPI002ED07D64
MGCCASTKVSASTWVGVKDDQRTPLLTAEDSIQEPSKVNGGTLAEKSQKPIENNLVRSVEKRQKPTEEKSVQSVENSKGTIEDDFITSTESSQNKQITPAENRQKSTEDDVIPAENGQKPTEDDLITSEDNKQKLIDERVNENGQKLSEDNFISPAKEDQTLRSPSYCGRKWPNTNRKSPSYCGRKSPKSNRRSPCYCGRKSTKVKIRQENDKTENRKTNQTEKDEKGVYELVDAHAINAPKHVNTSVNSLTEYLIKGAKSDKEKVRAFYIWIANNIEYDTDAYFGGNYGGTDADSVLKHGKSVCSGYANLFEAFCKIAGIQVQVISGFSKGYSYSPEKPFTPNTKTNHAWNAVFIENKWQFIECTWGAGHLNNAGEFQKQFNNFYFLTNPRHLIVDHFPFEYNDEEFSKKWQLLKNPISLDEFNRNIKLYSKSIEWDIHPKSHKYGVIEVKGSVEITIEDKKGHLFNTSFVFYEYPSGERVEEYGFLRKESAYEIKLTLNPPKVKSYRAELYGNIDPSQKSLDHLMTYAIKCTQAANVSPYPRRTEQWGFSQKAYDNGFLKSDQFKIPALQQSSNGQLELNLRTTRNVPSMVKLSHAKYDLGKKFAFVTSGKDFLKINLKFPSIGYYQLMLMCEEEKGTDDRYHEMGNLLVECKSPADSCIPFPVASSKAQEYLCILIEPLNGQLPANQQVKFKFQSPVVKKAIAAKEDMKQNGDEWSAVITTPGPGGSVQISGNDTDENRFWGLFTFEII